MGVPRSPAHVVLGDYLRTVREAAGKVQRDMSYSSGHVSAVENGCSMPSEEMLMEYVNMGGSHKVIGTLYAAAVMATKKRNRQRRQEQRNSGKPLTDPVNILEDFQETMARISARIGGFSELSYSLATQLSERLQRRQAELESDEENATDELFAGIPWGQPAPGGWEETKRT